MTFTTRPDLKGTFGMVASTHWLASAVGMKLLEAGGTAADAAVGMGMVLCVVEPHLNGPLGDLPLLVWPGQDDAPKVICGQGPAPAGATIAHYRGEGLDMIPGSGLLATVIPGAFDAWMLLLRDHGRLPLADVMAPAIHYAEHGHPILPNVCTNIAANADFFRAEWPSSAAVWLPNGKVPRPDALFSNPDLAAMWTRLLREAQSATGREAQIEAARRTFYDGFVADHIDRYLRDATPMDGTGIHRKGVLTAQDMSGWRATYEDAVSTDHAGWQIWKAGPWSQGPALLQALNILGHSDIAQVKPDDPRFVHLIAETLKLVMADREAYFGDPLHSELPLGLLLSSEYARERASLLGPQASDRLRPGHVTGYEHLAQAFLDRAARPAPQTPGIGAGEPTMAHLTNKDGDTVHLDVVDQWGNMVSATPSGGWLQSNPVVPGLGVPLNSRAQMFWLDDGLPTSLAPGRRPRTTLTPSVARSPDGGRLAFGTPGGDQQEQWQLVFLMRLIHHGATLQQAIDAPLFHTGHLQASFYPHAVRLSHLMVEPSLGPKALDALRAMGHELEVSAPWSVGRLTAVSRQGSGLLGAAATPRLMQAYAIGR